MTTMKNAYLLVTGAALLALVACSQPSGPTVDGALDATGALHVPVNYRATYQGLGSWAVAADKDVGAKEFHTVYASPGAAAAYARDHRFPDGTVLVKEVAEAMTAPMTTGTVSHSTKLKGWFVMVRDEHNRHTGSKLWGDGWGWAWFDADAPKAAKTTDYKAECLACHEPARKTDLSYVEGYPAIAAPLP